MSRVSTFFRTRVVVLCAIVGLACMVRLPRFVVRWDEVAIAYAAYLAPAGQLISEGRWGEALSAWVGLHPPLYAILVGLLDCIWPAPAVWMGLSVLCSVAAVAVVTWHKGAFAGLALASSSLHALDAAEVNNYSLAALGIALLVAVPQDSLFGRILAAGIACWGHVLGAVAAGAVTLWSTVRVREDRPIAILVGSALVALPVVAGTLRLMGVDSTYEQPAIDWSAWGRLVGGQLGILAVPMSILGVIGLGRAPGRAGVAFLALGFAYFLALALGVAAPHQRPYLGLFAPPAAVLVGRGVQYLSGSVARPVNLGLGSAFVLVCLIRSAVFVHADISVVSAIAEDFRSERGVDVALRSAQPGDTLWLVSPALHEDDDKYDYSSVLWRLSPFQSMQSVDIGGVPIDPTDWLYGHPRAVGSVVLHTSTELDLTRFDEVCAAAFARGSSVWVVLYDHLPAGGLQERVERAMRPYSTSQQTIPTYRSLGADFVWQVHRKGRSEQEGVGRDAP